MTANTNTADRETLNGLTVMWEVFVDLCHQPKPPSMTQLEQRSWAFHGAAMVLPPGELRQLADQLNTLILQAMENRIRYES